VESLKGIDLTGWPSGNLTRTYSILVPLLGREPDRTLTQMTQFSQRWVGPVAPRGPDPANSLFLPVD
jgi:hypothetical protein